MGRLRTHNNRARQKRKMQRTMYAFLKRIAIGAGTPTYVAQKPWRSPTYSAAGQYFQAMMGAKQ